MELFLYLPQSYIKDAANDEAVVFKTLFALSYTVSDTGTPDGLSYSLFYLVRFVKLLS